MVVRFNLYRRNQVDEYNIGMNTNETLSNYYSEPIGYSMNQYYLSSVKLVMSRVQN